MKKIDLHIHTVKTDSDAQFDFSLDVLGEYISQRKIDCIAITNHNMFEQKNYKDICDRYGTLITILPGIEVDLEGGHILVISNVEYLPNFIQCCQNVSQEWGKHKTSLSFEMFCSIFGDLNKYLLIPHYRKDKALREETIQKFGTHIVAGEVTNLKQFEVIKKNSTLLVPVVFSDCRICTDLLSKMPMSQTYIDSDICTSIAHIKICLGNRGKVFLEPSKIPGTFEVLEDGTAASTGLTVIMGERSSGKTFTLNRIFSHFPNMHIKYIRQFELIESGTEDEVKEKFKNKIAGIQALESEKYLDDFKDIINNVINIDLIANEIVVDNYLDSVLKVAFETEKSDIFSKTKLYNETDLVQEMHNDLDRIISAILLILTPSNYSLIIDKFIPKIQLENLVKELLTHYKKISEENTLKKLANDIISNTRIALQFKSSAPKIEKLDIIKYLTDSEMIGEFIKVASLLCREKRIRDDDLYGFKIVTETRKFLNADDVKSVLRIQTSIKDAFKSYGLPYQYLCALKDRISLDTLYKCFIRVDYSVKNRYGLDVSGGERAEFYLIHSLKDAFTYDMVLIDEPESSFDNLFLASKIKTMIRDLAENMPVIISTHNNTIGASFFPNRVIHTKRVIIPGNPPRFQVFSGAFIDKVLKDNAGNTIDNFSVYMDSLEGGEKQYDERKGRIYEAVKNC